MDLGNQINPDAAQKTAEKNRSKKAILIVATIVLVLVCFFAIRAFSKNSTYAAGVSAFEEKEYAAALESLTPLKGYKDADFYITECVYYLSRKSLKEGTDDFGVSGFETLGDYKASALYLEKAYMRRKYADFNKEITVDEDIYQEFSYKDKEYTELSLSKFYGTWNPVTEESASPIEIGIHQINGKYYGVLNAMHVNDMFSMHFYFIDQPEETMLLESDWEYFDYIGETIDLLYISHDGSDQEPMVYRSVSDEEYQELCELNAEAEASQPAYDNSTIIDKTLATFKKKIRGNYSGADVLYHGASYSDANVSYDWRSRTYTCTMMGEYTTNAFDFWGTSTSTYFVTAEYVDTGSGLTMTAFSIS